ncbi:MAG: PspC domain-containing protein [Paludibacteraceae bacterium]|nr:PspC domain-containing protein [Paludibacteraceae bacterium]
MMEPKKLRRSTNKMLAGVCAGIAEYLNLDPTVVRVAYVVISILSAAFPGVLLYLILMLLMPNSEDYTA